MRIIVGCEYSQVVTRAFREKGHEAFSCDILPTEGNPEWHIQGDILDVISDKWDMGIFFPPCTYLSYAGIRYWNSQGRCKKRLEALNFFRQLWEAPIEKICIENPKGCASPAITKYSQEIQPYYFGDSEQKTTWLWLKNLPLLTHEKEATLFDKKTHVEKPEPIYISPKGKKEYFVTAKNHKGKDRAKERARTFPKIAKVMSSQWS